jgi:predicted MFS family arabinose efflux permease
MFSVRTLAAAIIVLGAATQLSFIFMADPDVAIVLNVLNGALTAAAGINAHVIAARSCPDNAEGFMYSTLLAISNLSWSTSDWVGGVLYTHVFNQQMVALIAVSAGATLACLALLGLLRVNPNAQPPQH